MSETEKLLTCAKVVGLPVIRINTLHNRLAVYYQAGGEKGYNHLYHPLTNDAQAYELEGVLLENEWILHKVEGVYFFRRVGMESQSSENRREAAINAVVAMEEVAMSETQGTHYEAMGAALQRAAVMYTDGEPLERIAYYIENARMQCEKAKGEDDAI